MGVLKNGVGRPSNKTIMIRNILKTIGILVVIGLVGIFAYFYGKNEKNVNKEKQTKQGTEIKQEVVAREDAEKILKDFFGSDYYYSVGHISNDVDWKFAMAFEKTKPLDKKFDIISEFGGDFIKTLNSPIDNTDLEYTHDNTTYYLSSKTAKVHSYADIYSEYKKLFGNSSKLGKKNYYSSPLAYIYSKSLDAYVSAIAVWGDGGYVPAAVVDTAFENGNIVTINVLYAEIDAINDVTNSKIQPKTPEELNALKDKYGFEITKVKLTFKYEDKVYKLDSVK